MIMMQLGLGCGPLLTRCVVGVLALGREVGTTLPPRSDKYMPQEDVNNMIEKGELGEPLMGTRLAVLAGLWDTPPRALSVSRHSGADIYIYIYNSFFFV